MRLTQTTLDSKNFPFFTARYMDIGEFPCRQGIYCSDAHESLSMPNLKSFPKSSFFFLVEPNTHFPFLPTMPLFFVPYVFFFFVSFFSFFPLSLFFFP